MAMEATLIGSSWLMRVSYSTSRASGLRLGASSKSGAPNVRTSQSNLAGDENGLLASTTNKANSCKSAEPLLDTSIGVSPP